MDAPGVCSFTNGERFAVADVPVLPFEAFRDFVLGSVGDGGSLFALYGERDGERNLLRACVGDPMQGSLKMASTEVGDRYPSLTPDCPSAHWFEREIAEVWAIVPEGHPWLKPIRFHASRRPGHDAWGRKPEGIVVGDADFFQVHGDEVHEVAVGPVHAGVIEPGHFRFQCHGETVFLLEISLGYQHRGVERALVGAPGPKSIALAETLAGDTTVGHTTAYCEAVEALAGVEAPPRGQSLRGIALELERMANHVGDLGALAGDVAYLPTASFCGRLRGDILNMTGWVCGSRFGRSWIRPGGSAWDLDDAMSAELLRRLDAVMKDVTQAANLLWNTPSVMARFEGMGVVHRDSALSLGLVGPAARACAIETDVREQYPSGVYRFSQINVSTWDTCDVFARAYVRWLEIERSAAFIRKQLKELAKGAHLEPVGPCEANSMVVSLVEGWRGAICHVARTDAAGRIASYKVVDPSFHNWIGLAMALRNNPISEFPLCNKSFNLSYCGHDL
ncbi:MAG TPA: NADH-quinone oxidoreductase subunit C [Polyangiaceae bacterium]|nr:NADH-quinone oxidoreductase subunit C [Polyangiaceae bacterium]